MLFEVGGRTMIPTHLELIKEQQRMIEEFDALKFVNDWLTTLQTTSSFSPKSISSYSEPFPARSLNQVLYLLDRSSIGNLEVVDTFGGILRNTNKQIAVVKINFLSSIEVEGRCSVYRKKALQILTHCYWMNREQILKGGYCDILYYNLGKNHRKIMSWIWKELEKLGYQNVTIEEQNCGEYVNEFCTPLTNGILRIPYKKYADKNDPTKVDYKWQGLPVGKLYKFSTSVRKLLRIRIEMNRVFPF